MPTVATLVEDSLLSLGQKFEGRALALFVEQDAGSPSVARVLPSPTELPRDGYSLELRFASWLASLEVRQMRPVPTYLLPWLPIPRALVFPLRGDGRNHGALAIDVTGLARADVFELEQAVQELAERIAEVRSSAAPLRDSLPEMFVASMRRIKIGASED